MATRYYRLYCEICGFSTVTDGSNIKLVEYKRSKIQKELPKLDPATGKTAASSWTTLPKKYKCPKCGRLVSAKRYKETDLEDKTKNANEQDFNSGSKGGFERL